MSTWAALWALSLNRIFYINIIIYIIYEKKARDRPTLVGEKKIELLTTTAPYVPAPIKRHPIRPTTTTTTPSSPAFGRSWGKDFVLISTSLSSVSYSYIYILPPSPSHIYVVMPWGCVLCPSLRCGWGRQSKKKIKERNHGKTKFNTRQ